MPFTLKSVYTDRKLPFETTNLLKKDRKLFYTGHDIREEDKCNFREVIDILNELSDEGYISSADIMEDSVKLTDGYESIDIEVELNKHFDNPLTKEGSPDLNKTYETVKNKFCQHGLRPNELVEDMELTDNSKIERKLAMESYDHKPGEYGAVETQFGFYFS